MSDPTENDELLNISGGTENETAEETEGALNDDDAGKDDLVETERGEEVAFQFDEGIVGSRRTGLEGNNLMETREGGDDANLFGAVEEQDEGGFEMPFSPDSVGLPRSIRGIASSDDESFKQSTGAYGPPLAPLGSNPVQLQSGHTLLHPSASLYIPPPATSPIVPKPGPRPSNTAGTASHAQAQAHARGRAHAQSVRGYDSAAASSPSPTASQVVRATEFAAYTPFSESDLPVISAALQRKIVGLMPDNEAIQRTKEVPHPPDISSYGAVAAEMLRDGFLPPTLPARNRHMKPARDGTQLMELTSSQNPDPSWHRRLQELTAAGKKNAPLEWFKELHEDFLAAKIKSSVLKFELLQKGLEIDKLRKEAETKQREIVRLTNLVEDRQWDELNEQRVRDEKRTNLAEAGEAGEGTLTSLSTSSFDEDSGFASASVTQSTPAKPSPLVDRARIHGESTPARSSPLAGRGATVPERRASAPKIAPPEHAEDDHDIAKEIETLESLRANLQIVTCELILDTCEMCLQPGSGYDIRMAYNAIWKAQRAADDFSEACNANESLDKHRSNAQFLLGRVKYWEARAKYRDKDADMGRQAPMHFKEAMRLLKGSGTREEKHIRDWYKQAKKRALYL